MAWLLIDNSNSRTKLRLGDHNGLLNWGMVVPTANIGGDFFRDNSPDETIEGVMLASVVPEKAELIRSFFDGNTAFHELSHLSPLGYGFDLEHPEQIGSDRLANIVALKAGQGGPGIAIDFGTAVTFSVLTIEGNFAGGVIAPGMEAMTSYLREKTAKLPPVSLAEPGRVIGRTTVEAIISGAVFGQRGMVREILQELVREIGGDVRIVATGGGAEFAAQGLTEIDAMDRDLTLEGLRLVAKRVF